MFGLVRPTNEHFLPPSHLRPHRRPAAVERTVEMPRPANRDPGGNRPGTAGLLPATGRGRVGVQQESRQAGQEHTAAS